MKEQVLFIFYDLINENIFKYRESLSDTLIKNSCQRDFIGVRIRPPPQSPLSGI